MDFKRIIDQGDSCVFSNKTDHLFTHMLAHPTDRPVSPTVNSGRTARKHVEKIQNPAHSEACLAIAFMRRCHATVQLPCNACDYCFLLHIVHPNSRSSSGYCLIPASAMWILLYLVGFHSALTPYSLLMPVDWKPACDAFAWRQTGSSSSPLMILINLAPGQTLLIYLRGHLPLCVFTAQPVHFTSPLLLQYRILRFPLFISCVPLSWLKVNLLWVPSTQFISHS